MGMTRGEGHDSGLASGGDSRYEATGRSSSGTVPPAVCNGTDNGTAGSCREDGSRRNAGVDTNSTGSAAEHSNRGRVARNSVSQQLAADIG